MNTTKKTVTVKFYKEDKGFGFITHAEGEIFVHATGLITKPIRENDMVEFDVEQGQRGPQAVNVIAV